jgi:hypothetical protein
MATIEGNLLKMRAELSVPVNYFLPLSGAELTMNPLIGNDIRLSFPGQINCISCGKKTKSSFGQGFCYNCMQTAPEASESITRPELSKAHFGIARDMDWAREHDLIDHFVYLAVASDLKVGVTRHHQIPARWIDQGASYAVKIAKTPNRHIAGVIEVWMKKHYSDTTNWRTMLQHKVATHFDLLYEKEKALQLLPAELRQYRTIDDTITSIDYPVIAFPEKITSLSFDNQPVIDGKLVGIKGQYLIFSNGSVFNIRKHSGYYIKAEY